jgi:NodT family efflux transporter outer membrane factor (OMF) lipoprotein
MGRRPLIAAVFGAIACAACNIAPKYQRPEALPPTVFPAGFKELKGSDEWKTATPSDELLKGKWWEIFGDPQLNELEEMINVSNQNVKVAEQQFLAARAAVDLQHAGFFPSIGSAPGISRSQTSSELATLQGRQQSTFTLPVSAGWEADVWGRIRTAVEGATDAAQLSASTLENVRLSLQAALASDYFSLASVDMQIKLLDDTIAAYQTYVQLTVNRFNGGVASRADVALAQTQLATTQAERTDLSVTRAQLEHTIAVLTGRPPSNVEIPLSRINAPPPPIPVAVPSLLLERRPDISAAERTIAEQNATLGLAKIAFYPTISLSASAGFQAAALQNLFTWPARIWSLGPGVSETLFDFGRRKSTMAEVQANYDASVASYRQTVLAAFQDVEDNLSALRYLAQEAAQEAEAVAAAQQSLSLETDRYKAGTVSYLDVITTQTIALNDERNAVSLLQRRMVASVNLIKALGGGWDASALPSYDQIRSVGLADEKAVQDLAQPITK